MSSSQSPFSAASSSEWESTSSSSMLGVETSSQTLNFSLDDRCVHEPLTLSPLVPSIHSAAHSVDTGSRSQLTTSKSLDTFYSTEDKQLPSQASSYQPEIPSASSPGDVARPVFLLPAPTYNVASVRYPANFAGMDTVNVPELVERLGSEEDAVRKMAVFKLQSNIGDPSFAEIFIQEGGLPKLKYLAVHATGNTLAYSLTSFSRLLEVDKGWDFVEQDLIERVGIGFNCLRN